MIKTIVFNLESIADMQKILKIQSSSPLSSSSVLQATKAPIKRSFVEDFTKNYPNIKVRKIVTEKPPEVLVVESSPEMPKRQPEPSIIKPVREYNVNTIHRSFTKTPVRAPQEAPKAQSADKKVYAKAVTIQSKVKTETPKMVCARCDTKFDSKSEAEAHLKSCKDANGKKHTCFCGEVLNTSQELNKHVASCDKKTEQPKCKPCKKIFKTIALFQQHVCPTVSYSCTNCGKKMETQEQLKTHRSTCQRKSNEA